MASFSALLKRRIKKILGIKIKHPSETSKVRHLVLPYCEGFGCDAGFGGDKIKKENCLGIDFPKPYGYTGEEKVDIGCDLSKEAIPVEDNYFDYVYSSHLIEDFEDTNRILKDFCRITKSGGNIVLVFPDQQVYEKHCKETGQLVNVNHVHKTMGFEFMKNCFLRLQQDTNINLEILFTSNCEIDYNVIIVARITKK